MKKNDIILIVSALLYSYLFYAQSAGINFQIFTIVLISGLIIKDRKVTGNKTWLAVAAASIISGTCVMIYGNTLSVITNVLSLSLAAGYALSSHHSLVFNIIHSFYSYLSSAFFIILDYAERKKEKAEDNVYGKLLITGVPIIVAIAFFFIYQEANPIFKNFIGEIDLSFFSWSWIGFTLLGFIILYGFYFPKQIEAITQMDFHASDTLTRDSFALEDADGKSIILGELKSSGVVLFGLLNILLLSVNVLDINYLWISGTLPKGMTYSELVHQGIHMLIISIVLAIAIILYYFRGGLNFYKNNRTLKVLVFIWIIQNAVMILSSGIKNDMYIHEYGLTYKRIGVYVYLLLSLIGIVTTFIKIWHVKSNWFLFRKNSWAFYAVLVISCFFNWDRIITSYNINYSKNLDKSYLLYYLSDSALPELMSLKYIHPDPADQYKSDNYMQNRKARFLEKCQQTDWQSWNFENHKIKSELEQIK